MNSVEKPGGFDLRDRRSSRAGDARLWDPRDALYDASLVMPEDAKCAAVVWVDAKETVHARYAGEKSNVIAALTTVLVRRTME